MREGKPEARLLVVEDEPNILELLSASLRLAGFEVATATGGLEALTAAQRHRPDLVVLDVMVPELDGFDVARRLRSGGARTPVLFLTARDATEDKVRGLTVGPAPGRPRPAPGQADRGRARPGRGGPGADRAGQPGRRGRAAGRPPRRRAPAGGAAVGRRAAAGPAGRARAGPGPRSPYLVQYRDADGHLEQELSNELLQEGQRPPRVPDDPAWREANAGRSVTVPATGGDGRWRVAVQPLRDGSGGSVVVAASLDGTDSTVRQLRAIDLGVSLVVLGVLAEVGAAVVRASLRPLVEIEQTARAIAAGDLTRRVPDRDPRTEVGRLGRALNAMLAQIEAAFGARAAPEASARRSEEAARRSEDRMRRFVADASHELRTPLTTIRGFAELYRQGASSSTPAELDRLMRRIEDQAARMGLLVEDLLLLARLDQQRPLERLPVDLLALAADAVSDARAVAPDRQIELVLGSDDGDRGGAPERRSGIDVASRSAVASAGPSHALRAYPTGALVVLGDAERLRQVLTNLVDNALTHTPGGSPVEVRVGGAALDGRPGAAVEVVDHGHGLTPEQAERVFERFYRADPARSRAAGGTGLGLSIVAALVAAHGGTVRVDGVPGRGPDSAWSSPSPPTRPTNAAITVGVPGCAVTRSSSTPPRPPAAGSTSPSAPWTAPWTASPARAASPWTGRRPSRAGPAATTA
jgi:signal transduction histidine kinase